MASELEQADWLEVYPIGPFTPLEFTVGILPQDAGDDLFKLLFDPVSPNHDEIIAWGDEDPPPYVTYAILDAGALSLLPELLDDSGLPNKCLFTGKALAEWGDSAPWLVQLDSQSSFFRRLMTKIDGGGYWELQLGIFIRSRQSFDAVWKHVRKFTRVEDDKGAWFFNRFWSPPVSTALMQLGNHPDLVQFVSPLFPSGREALQVIAISNHTSAIMSRLPGTSALKARPKLTPQVEYWLRHIRRIQQFEDLILIAQRHVRKKIEIDTLKSAAHLRGHRGRFFEIGFWRRDHLTMLCVWELMLGPNFINDYEGGAIRNTILSAPSDWQAIKAIRALLDPPEEMSDHEVQTAAALEQAERKGQVPR